MLREGKICQQTGVLLVGPKHAPNSPVVDHIIPHNGNEVLFWSEDNLQLVSKDYHDSQKQKIEKSGRRASRRPEWIKPSVIPVTLVCGPPAAGKTTYVQSRRDPTDIVIDLDVIVAELSGQNLSHNWSRDEWLEAGLWRRNDLIGRLHKECSARHAWIIASAAKPSTRDWWKRQLGFVEVVVLETDAETCRIQSGKDIDRDQSRTRKAISAWWDAYIPTISDIKI